MLKFTLRRVLKGILCVWFIWSLIFFMVRLTGDPTDWMLPDGASDAEIAKLRASMHLDEPLSKQYIDSLVDLFHGEAGQSYYYKRDVTGLYAERLATTLKLAVPAFTLAILMGVTLGSYAAIRHNSDLVGILDGGQSVCDNERRSALAECVKCLLDQNFGRIVKCGGRFVKDQDRRIL